MSVIFDGTEGSPLASMAQMETRNVWHAGKEPPVEDCEIIPITGAPAPVALNSFNGSLPVAVMRGQDALREVAVRLVDIERPLAREQRVVAGRLDLVRRPRRPERDGIEQARQRSRRHVHRLGAVVEVIHRLGHRLPYELHRPVLVERQTLDAEVARPARHVRVRNRHDLADLVGEAQERRAPRRHARGGPLRGVYASDLLARSRRRDPERLAERRKAHRVHLASERRSRATIVGRMASCRSIPPCWLDTDRQRPHRR